MDSKMALSTFFFFEGLFVVINYLHDSAESQHFTHLRLRPMCLYSETSDTHTEDPPRPFLLLSDAKTGEP